MLIDPKLQVILENDKVKLIPLETKHAQDLVEAASDGKLWDLWFTYVPSEENISLYINKAIEERIIGKAYPFTIIDKASSKIIGSTRFCNIENRRLEIGFTWYAKSFQKTGSNINCKYLLLRYAFENLDCIAVEFRTNYHNQKSRQAIANLGAKQDGILRNHLITPNGTLRDTVVFSIINQEWLSVKKLLEFKMQNH